MTTNYISLTDYYATPSLVDAGKFISNDTSVCQFSSLQKFIEFFKSIFTRHYKPSEYNEIYELLQPTEGWEHANNPTENLCPLFALLRMIDMTSEHQKECYSIRFSPTEMESDNVKAEYLFGNTIITESVLPKKTADDIKRVFYTSEDSMDRVYFYKPHDAGVNIKNKFMHACQVDGTSVQDIHHEIESDPFISDPFIEDHTIDSPPYSPTFSVLSEYSHTRSINLLSATVDEKEEKSIDNFINDIAGKDISIFSEDEFLGAGGYGTAYRQGDFVVKIMLNRFDNWTCLEQQPYAHPKRVNDYLNQANDDANFSRHVKMEMDGKAIDVLVTKYIPGVSKLGAKEREVALQMLASRGLYMHDHNKNGNIIKTENDKFYFVDGDQIVLSEFERRQRKVSLATQTLENEITSVLLLKQHRGNITARDKNTLHFIKKLQKTEPRETPAVA